MSEPISPLRQWPAGIPQASPAANENALRLEAFLRPCLGVANDAAGGDSHGDVYIVGDSPSGAFSEFSEHDIALFQFGSWYAWEPFTGARLVVNDVRMLFDGSDWIEDPAGGGIPEAPIDGNTYGRKDGDWEQVAGGAGVAPVVPESGTSLTADGTNSGNYTRFTNGAAKTYTFDDAEDYVVGAEYHGRNVGAGDLTIVEAGGMTIHPPAGGTLVIPQGGTFTVKIVAVDEADLFGVTEEASS